MVNAIKNGHDRELSTGRADQSLSMNIKRAKEKFNRAELKNKESSLSQLNGRYTWCSLDRQLQAIYSCEGFGQGLLVSLKERALTNGRALFLL